MSNYLLLAVAADFPQAPDSSALDVTGDVELEFDGAIFDWTPAGTTTLLWKRNGAGTEGYGLALRVGGILCFYGSSSQTWSSTAGVSLAADSRHVIKATLDVDDGAGDAICTFYVDDVQLGDPVALGSTTALVNTNEALTVCSNRGTSPWLGHVYGAKIRSGIGGTLAFDADFTNLTAAELEAGEFVEDSVNAATVTLNGDEWAYVRPVTSGILSRAELLLQADDGNEGASPKWADRSGNDHHAQLGSAAGADTNDPEWLPHDGDSYVRTPGVNGNFLSALDSAAVSVTGDLDIRLKCSLDDWSPPGTIAVLFGKSNSAADYGLGIGAGGQMRLHWYTAAAAAVTVVSTVVIPFTDGAVRWIRATLDVDNGASGYEVIFYTSTDGVSWTQLGATVTGGATTDIRDSSSTIALGANNAGTVGVAGCFYAAQIYDGIDGTLVFDCNLNDAEEPFATFTERANDAVVTINRSGSGLYVVDRPSWGLHTDDYFEVADHADLDFAADEDFTALTVIRPSDATPTADEMLMAKKADLSTAAGYALYLDTTGVPTLVIADGAASTEATGPSLTTHTQAVIAVKRDTTADTITVYTDGVAGTPVTDTTTLTLANAEALRTGRLSGAGTNYADGEEFSDALFREALTDAEIADAGEALLGLGGVPHLMLMGVG